MKLILKTVVVTTFFALPLQVKASSFNNLESDTTKVGIAKTDTTTTRMEKETHGMKEFVVVAAKKQDNEVQMVKKTKESPVTVSTVSSSEIKKTQDANAGEVIKRIPGVSIIEEKFVMVRGLSQRYNNVWINDGAVPSSEADQRAFSFDIIPSSQIDNMQIVKTPSPELPADYTGGFIQIYTKEIPIKNMFEISLGTNWNSSTHFKEFGYAKGSSTDFLGFDSGLRSLSGGIKSTLNPLANGYSLSDNNLNNNWLINTKRPFGDLKISSNIARKWRLDGYHLGMVAAVNYTNEYRTYHDMENNLYGAYDLVSDRPVFMHHYKDQQYNNNVRLGAMFNVTLLSALGNNKFQLKNIFNQLGTNRYTMREGFGAQSDMERSAEYFYRSRTTYNGQLTGKHTLKNDEINWSTGYAYANRHMPDRRRYLTNDRDDLTTDDQTTFSWYSSNDVSREWTQLDEHIFSANIGDKHQFAFGNWKPTLLMGAYGEYRTRQYYTRLFIYNWNAANNTLPAGFRQMDMPILLSNQEYFGADKLYLIEQMQMRNNYKGNNTLGAGYFAANLPFGKLNIYAGLRFEHNKMVLENNTSDTQESYVSSHYTNDDFFPSVNANYKFDNKNQLRFSYGRTVNRPEFRELSPSVYYDFDLASNVQGNTALKNCYINNIDFRYEWYPSAGEIISLAAFYKHFDNPIEWIYTVAGGTDLIYSYKNAKSARSYGLELDVRKSLDFIGLPDFNISVNGALINSRVLFSKDDIEEDRPMQGQSPYLINAGLFYKNKRYLLDISLLYNRIGKRIVGVGRSEGTESKTVHVPNSYEMPRDVLDLNITKRFGNHWELRLNVRDIFAEKVRFLQFDKKSDGSEIEEITKEFCPGRNIGLYATYKF